MGFNFVTEPSEHEKQITTLKKQIEGLEGEIAKLNEFLELVGRGHLYDLWKDGLYDPKAETTADEYVDFEDLSLDDVSSLENEK
jgi:hypothetical protein